MHVMQTFPGLRGKCTVA